MINTKVHSINLLKQHKNQVVKKYNTKSQVVLCLTKQSNLFNHFAQTKQVIPFNQHAQTTQKPSHLMYNTKSQVISLSTRQSFCSNNTQVCPFNRLAQTTQNTSHLMITTKVRSINLLKQHNSQVDKRTTQKVKTFYV
jgi:hypothetical protein